MAKRGLPQRAVMRHDSHYVEELTKRSGRHIGTMLPIEFVEPVVVGRESRKNLLKKRVIPTLRNPGRIVDNS